MCKTKLNSSLQYNNNENESAQTHRDNPWPDQSQNTSRLFIPEEAEDTTISSASSFSIIYGILSEIDRKCQYIKIKTNTTETTYYIQESLFNPNSSINKTHQFLKIVPLSLLTEYVAVFLDSSQKVIGVQRFQPNKNTLPNQYSFPDKNLSSTSVTDINTLNNQCIDSPGRLKRDIMTDKNYTSLSYNNTSFTGDACHSVSARTQNDPSIPVSIKSESEDTEISSDSDFFPIHPEFDIDELVQDYPLFNSYPNMPSSIPSDIDIEHLNNNFNYALTIKFNNNHPNIFLMLEAFRILSQATYGKLFIVPAISPTKMSSSTRELINHNLKLMTELSNKIQRTLNQKSKSKEIELLELLKDYDFINDVDFIFLLYHSNLFWDYADSSNLQNIEILKQCSDNYSTPNHNIYNKKLKEILNHVSNAYNNAQKHYQISQQYSTAFNTKPFGLLHAHGAAQEIDWSLLGNYELKTTNNLKLYKIPINYLYYGQLRSSKVEITIQQIDKKRYEIPTRSIHNLLNYFFSRQNQPTTYWTQHTFDKYNAQSNFQNLKKTEDTITISTTKENTTHYEQLSLIKIQTKPIYGFSDTIPTFNLPGDPNDHTLFDFWPELNQILDKLFPDPYIYYNIYIANAGYNLLSTPPQTDSNSFRPELAFSNFTHRTSSYLQKCKFLFIQLSTYAFINNYDFYKLLKSETINYINAINNGNRSSLEYDISYTTIPSIETLYRFLQSSNIQENPSNPVYEDPKYYWQLIKRIDLDSGIQLTRTEYTQLLSQHNKLCLEASQKLQNQFLTQTNIINHIQPENGLESLLEPLNAKLKNYDSFTPDCLSSRLTLFSQIYQNSSFSSFSLISHKNYQIYIKIHQNIKNYIIPYIDSS